jgi:hypothetical protein
MSVPLSTRTFVFSIHSLDTNQLVYVPGTSNMVADALSRPAAAAGTAWVCAAIADRSPLDLKQGWASTLANRSNA